MAYIAPNSTVQFFGDLGISPNYENTLYFGTVGNKSGTQVKDEYFDALTPIATATALSYTREQRGFFKVELPMSTLINAGYIRFKNTSFENKWFYAFVKNVEYVNNVTTQVNFELDVMMTWMGTFTLNECFIERQHTLGDAIGANIADEKLETGEFVCEGVDNTTYFQNYAIALYKAYNPDKDSGTIHSDYAQGTYVPVALYKPLLDSSGADTISDILESIQTDNRTDEILCIKIVPNYFTAKQDAVPTATKAVSKPYSGSTAWGNFVPHNNKLYTYPYKHLNVVNCEGDSCVYKYEYFNSLPDATSSGNCQFALWGTAITPEVNIMCIPASYKGLNLNYSEAITMQNFPTACFVVDGYKAYLAQRDSTIFGNAGSNIVQGAVTGVITGGPGGALVGGGLGLLSGAKGAISDWLQEFVKSHADDNTLLGSVLSSITGGSVPSRVPDELKGKMSSNVMVQTRQKDFYFKKMCITKNYAMMIDNFFDLYGYAVKQHAVPNMSARPYWTYVKTVGCSVSGNLPADDGAQIESIFDKGVRFWKNHNHIGHYSSYNNAPT